MNLCNFLAWFSWVKYLICIPLQQLKIIMKKVYCSGNYVWRFGPSGAIWFLYSTVANRGQSGFLSLCRVRQSFSSLVKPFSYYPKLPSLVERQCGRVGPRLKAQESPGILLKWRLWSSKLGVGPKMQYFKIAFKWCWCCQSIGHTFSSKHLEHKF